MNIWTDRKHKRTGKALTNHIHGLCQAYMDEILTEVKQGGIDGGFWDVVFDYDTVEDYLNSKK